MVPTWVVMVFVSCSSFFLLLIFMMDRLANMYSVLGIPQPYRLEDLMVPVRGYSWRCKFYLFFIFIFMMVLMTVPGALEFVGAPGTQMRA